MPYVFEAQGLKIPRKYDRRIKLNDKQREEIKKLYQTGKYSYRSLAKLYDVEKTTIGYIVNLSQYERNRQAYIDRRKDGRYYDKDKHRQATMKTRQYKYSLYNNHKLAVKK